MMDVTLKCNRCSKEIKGEGIIDEGLPYDKICFGELEQDREGEDFKALSEQYGDGIEEDDLYDLWESYGDHQSDLKRCLDSNWAVIITDDGKVDIWSYPTKAGMLNDLADSMDKALYENYCICPIYFMRKGKAIADAEGYKLKIVLTKKQK